jgi:CubicO group peptidase (beta-lactamase class C family)
VPVRLIQSALSFTRRTQSEGDSMIRLTVVLLCLMGLVGPASGQKAPATISKEDLRALLEKARKKHDVPALGAAVVSSKGLQVLAVSGLRKRGADVAVEEGDSFHLGSDTKAMTATLLAILVQKKQLSYDLTLAKAFPSRWPSRRNPRASRARSTAIPTWATSLPRPSQSGPRSSRGKIC